ncbi:MAG: T9SS type A sorting domain-containing protein [bacterium]|nr:T9SS type A sorting domain-containing protein [bacterium]
MNTKTWLLCLYALLGGYQISQASSQLIICGDRPGEIYFTGVHPRFEGLTGFYFSSNSGETLSLLNNQNPPYFLTDNFVKDADDSTFHSFGYDLSYGYADYLTTDNGQHWTFVNEIIDNAYTYASGVIPGEIYCVAPYPIENHIQKSINYGQFYNLCTTTGINDSSLGISDIALGSDSGEVYIITGNGGLFHSSDNGENFTWLNNIHQAWGIPPYNTQILKSSSPGEIYAFWGLDSNVKTIWRIYNYGTAVDTIGIFGLWINWKCSPAISNTPGEVFFYAVAPDMVPGGTMRIYHTTNDGQSWEMFEHTVPNGVKPFNIQASPNNISLSLYPNPANASFNLQYDLNQAQNVIIDLINPQGQMLWQNNIGFQLPGTHTLNYRNDRLPSGTYLLRLQINDGEVIRSITIVK